MKFSNPPPPPPPEKCEIYKYSFFKHELTNVLVKESNICPYKPTKFGKFNDEITKVFTFFFDWKGLLWLESERNNRYKDISYYKQRIKCINVSTEGFFQLLFCDVPFLQVLQHTATHTLLWCLCSVPIFLIDIPIISWYTGQGFVPQNPFFGLDKWT